MMRTTRQKKENLYRVDENAINNVLPPTSGLMKNALNDVLPPTLFSVTSFAS